MFKKSNLFFLLFIAAIAVLIWWSYPVINDRYFKEEAEIEIIPPADEDKIEKNASEDDLTAESEDMEKIEQEQEALKEEGKIFQKITMENCDTECEGFSGDALEYCKEVCGLKPVQEGISGCDGLEGIKKDYCLKDLAVTKKDFKICEEIKDENVKATCKNRIIEEILEEQSSI